MGTKPLRFGKRIGDGQHIIDKWHKCSFCHLPTRTTEVNFETSLHRGICSRMMWRRYERAK